MFLQQAEVAQALGRFHDRRLDGTRLPAEHALRAVVVDDQIRRFVPRFFLGGHALGDRPESIPQDLGHLQEADRGAVGEHQEALARRLGHRHRADVHVGYIAHIGDAEALAADNGRQALAWSTASCRTRPCAPDARSLRLDRDRTVTVSSSKFVTQNLTTQVSGLGGDRVINDR